MERATPQSTEAELARRRSDIRRSLLRVSTAGLIVLTVVVGLAVAAVLTAVREQRSAVRAEAATARAEEELRKSHLAQARVGRASALMGRKKEGLVAVASAARIQPSLEARNEAIAHFALLDLEDTGLRWPRPVPGQVVFDPALKQFASKTNGTLVVGRVSDLTTVCQYAEAGMRIERMLRFAPNGRFVALACREQRLLIFDVEKQQPAFWADVPQTLRGVAFTPDSELTAFVHADKSVRVVRTAGGEEVVRFQPGGQPYLLHFDSEGKRLAVTTGRRVLTYELKDGKTAAPLDLVRPIYSLAWMGTVMVLGDGYGELFIHHEKRGTRRFVAHKDRVSDLFFTPDGHHVYSVSYDGSTRLWDVESGRMLLSTTIGYARQVSADGRRVAYANAAGWGLWQVQPPIGYRTLHTADGLNPFIYHLDFSPDGRLFTMAKSGALRIADAASGEVLLTHQEAGLAPWAQFLADGQTLVTARKDALWLPSLTVTSNGTSPKLVLGSGPQITVPGIDAGCVGAMSPDRHQVAVPLGRTGLATIDLENPEKTVRFGGVSRPLRPALAPDKSWMASGSLHGSGTILWDATTGKQRRILYSGNAYCFASPDGLLLAVAGSDAYRMFDTRSWEVVRTIPSERGSELPNFAAFSSDGRLLAIVKEHSRIQLWDPRRWRLLADLISPDPQIIHWLAFSPDARRLAVATTRDRVELWDLSVLRTQLGKLALDWSEAGDERDVTPVALAATHVSGLSGATTVLVTVMAGVGLVILCAGFVLRRQRELISAYLQVDRQMEQRTRELELAQAEILHGQRMKALGTLAAGIAHDFNNLLSIIRMANKLSGQESPANPEVQENVRLVEKAVGQGKQLINSMLGYSRESSEHQGPFQVAEVVDSGVGLLSRQFLSGIELKLEMKRQLPLVGISKSRLEQILLNLIVNASEAMKGGGVLRIGVNESREPNGAWTLPPTKAGSYVQLTVGDSGPGIPPEILPRIFEPFFTTKHVGATRGTGLGLSMVYTLAQHEGMGIRVESTPGEGTTFFIVIPTGEAA